MARQSFEKMLFDKFGDNIWMKNAEPDECGYVIVTDGEYDYRVKKSLQIGFKLSSPLAMTKESKLKRFNKECCDDIKAVDFFIYKQNPTVELKHTPTGHSELRNARIVCLRKYSETVRKHALKHESFVKRAIEKFGDNITYEKTNYLGINFDITVTCKKHGDITLNADSFINDNYYGCPVCGKEFRSKGMGFSRTAFENKCKNGVGYLYLVYCYDENESFYKIGITSKKELNYRFGNTSRFPYGHNRIVMVEAHPHIIFYMEDVLLRKFKKLKYKPLKHFSGETECFSLKINNPINNCSSLIMRMAKEMPESKKFSYLK